MMSVWLRQRLEDAYIRTYIYTLRLAQQLQSTSHEARGFIYCMYLYIHTYIQARLAAEEHESRSERLQAKVTSLAASLEDAQQQLSQAKVWCAFYIIVCILYIYVLCVCVCV